MQCGLCETDRQVTGLRGLMLVAAVLFAFLSGPIAARADEKGKVLEDRWYVVQLRGQRAGYVHDRVELRDGKITTTSEMVLQILREKAEIGVRFVSEFVETETHTPVSMRSEQKLGAKPTITTYRFTADGVEVVQTGAGGETRKMRPLPEGAWLTPRQVEDAVQKALQAGDQKIVIRSVDPLFGLDPTTVTHVFIDRKPIEALGRDMPAVMWETTSDRYANVKSVEYVDERGRIIQSETSMGGIRMKIVRADRDLALAKLDPPELLQSTMITPNVPIDRARTAVRAEYLVRSTGETLDALPTAGAQRATRVDAKTFRVNLDVYKPVPATAAEIADQSYRTPSAMIESADTEVIKLKDKAIALCDANATAQARAQTMRRAVSGWIAQKNLDVGFASAAEVARTRRGDCSEHAVLLAAMLRANGIPARVVSGLVYVEGAGQLVGGPGKGVFGYHMWTQALVENANGEQVWIDYDATLPAALPFDAAHIALGVSALADGGAATSNDLIRMAPMIGTLSIEVENVERSVLSQ